MMTSFTRLIVVMSFVRNALSLQLDAAQSGAYRFGFFLTVFIMAPVWTTIYQESTCSVSCRRDLDQEEAFTRGIKPIREFMLKNTYEKDLELFINVANLRAGNLMM